MIFYKDAKQLVFAKYELKAEKGAEGYTLSVKAKGETLDQQKHTLVADVKAVSWHKFKVEKNKGTVEGGCNRGCIASIFSL